MEEVDELLGAIYDTLEIKEQETLSGHDRIYQGLKKMKPKVFLVH